jgi:hypothetical protein
MELHDSVYGDAPPPPTSTRAAGSVTGDVNPSRTWDHKLVVEEVLDSPPDAVLCTAGRMPCPPE